MQLADVCPNVEIVASALDEPGGEDILRTCLALAANRAFLVEKPGLCDLDMAAVGRLMASAARQIEKTVGNIDAIFCGDADPGGDGLGPTIAGWLGWPQVVGVCKADPAGQYFQIWKNWDEEFTCSQVKTPCVVSFLPFKGPARYPQLPRLMAANQAELPILRVQTESYLRETMTFQLRPRARQIFCSDNAVDALVALLIKEHIV